MRWASRPRRSSAAGLSPAPGCFASCPSEDSRSNHCRVTEGMTPEQHRRARDLFEAALDREPAEVSRWLDDSAPDDSDVRAEVRSLLDHHSRAGSFLTQPLAEAAPHLLEEDVLLEP